MIFFHHDFVYLVNLSGLRHVIFFGDGECQLFSGKTPLLLFEQVLGAEIWVIPTWLYQWTSFKFLTVYFLLFTSLTSKYKANYCGLNPTKVGLLHLFIPAQSFCSVWTRYMSIVQQISSIKILLQFENIFLGCKHYYWVLNYSSDLTLIAYHFYLISST